MYTTTVVIPDDLAVQLEPYRGSLDDLLRIGLREVKKEQGLALFKQGHVSLWKAARFSRRLPARHGRICGRTGLAGNS